MPSLFRRIRHFFAPTSQSAPPSAADTAMKYLVVGLGNIGAEYVNTRHNIGFNVVEQLALKHEAAWKTDTLGDLARFKHKGRTFILLKPNTYMNRSGKATNYWLDKEKIPKERLLVIVDDLALDFGVLRLRGKGSPGTHNGLKDIDQVTGGGDYARLRVGIGNDFPQGRQVDFVLGHWGAQEQAALPEVLAKAAEATLSWGTIGLAHTMNAFNG